MFDYPDGFYYTVYDIYGQYADASVTIMVFCPDPPTAESQNFETPAQTPLMQQLVVNSSAPLIFDISQFPSYGIVDTIEPSGKCLYTPDYDFCSLSDVLDNWGFDVQDIYGQGAFALVFIKVLCPPSPKPRDTTVRTVGRANQVLNLTLPIDAGTQPFYIEVSQDPLNGYLGPFDVDERGRNALTTFTPVDGYCNVEDVPDPFNWMVFDPFGQFGEATCAVFIRCPDAPTARDQNVFMEAGGSRLVRLQVTGSPPLDYLVYSPPGNGNISAVFPNNSVLYTPNADFCSINGFTDTMFYTVSDVFGQTADGSLIITVNCPPEPIADDVYASMTTAQPSISIRPAIKPPNGKYSVTVNDKPVFGTATWQASDGTFLYEPRNGTCRANTNDQFVYAVDDVYGQPTAYGNVFIACVKAD